MKIDKKSLKNIFHTAGWSELPLDLETERLGFCGIYALPYALVAFVWADSASDVVARWPECQVQMAKLRPEVMIRSQKDMYLVFLVPKVEQEVEARLLRVLSDTYVCRKSCIEMEKRALEEVINDLPFVNTAAIGHQDNHANIIPLVDALDLPSELKRDLAKKGPVKNLDKVLAGKYSPPERRQ